MSKSRAHHEKEVKNVYVVQKAIMYKLVKKIVERKAKTERGKGERSSRSQSENRRTDFTESRSPW